MTGRSMNNADDYDKYRFSGKELDREEGLNWYYFGARYYDPAIARWHSVDPKADKYPSWSPYNYCINNPVLVIDPNGDTTDVGGYTDIALQYLQSTIPGNEYRLTMDANGRLAFDNTGIDASSDIALFILDVLVNGQKKFLFEVCEKTYGLTRSNFQRMEIDFAKPLAIGVANLSKFSKNANNNNLGLPGLLPKGNYDGQISLGTGYWTNKSKTGIEPVSNTVFHELMENFYRTYGNLPYQYLPGSGQYGAHDMAKFAAMYYNNQKGTDYGSVGNYYHIPALVYKTFLFIK